MSLFQILNITADNLQVQRQLAELASMRIATITMPDASVSSKFGVGDTDVSVANQSLGGTIGLASNQKTTLADEFVAMTLARRAYETNVRIFNLASSMYRNALEIGK